MTRRIVTWASVPAAALWLFATAGQAGDPNLHEVDPSADLIHDAAPSYPYHDFTTDTSFRVTRVIDGDTVEIQHEGALAKVRFIGVDTPETVHPDRPVEPYGEAASKYMANLLTGERVYLRFGDEERDKYGRVLAYVFRAPDGMFVNLELVRQGYGRAYVRYPFKHMDLFQMYEARAKKAAKGLWGVSDIGE